MGYNNTHTHTYTHKHIKLDPMVQFEMAIANRTCPKHSHLSTMYVFRLIVIGFFAVCFVRFIIIIIIPFLVYRLCLLSECVHFNLLLRLTLKILYSPQGFAMRFSVYKVADYSIIYIIKCYL